MSKVAIYARVSTSDKGQNPEVQLHALREYCRQREFTVFKEYVDHLSGAREDRPAFIRMMDDARKRKIDAVLVFRFDRFARSTKSLLLALEEFRELGIDFISYSENVDTSTPMGKMMYTIISALSEFERSIIKQRVMSGLQKARDDGKRLGRPRVGFNMGKCLQLKSDGLGVRRIAKQLGVSHGTVFNYLASVSTVQKTSPQNAPVSVN